MTLPLAGTGHPDQPTARAVVHWSSLLLIFAVAVIVSASVGRFSIPLADVLNIVGRWLSGALAPETMEERILINVRVPRILLAAIVGAGLALCGAALQALFRNPLVSPRVLGVSSGAALGGALTLLIGGGATVLFAATFSSALFALVLVAVISRVAGRTILSIVLAGIAPLPSRRFH